MAGNQQDEQRLALFIDFENIAIGVRDAHYRKFDVNLVLERLLEKGKLLSKKAYADWSRYSDYKRSFHEAAIELIEVPQKSLGGKNSADIRLVVDAMDMSFQKEHINCFVVASGDSDFSPLVSKLKENNKYVIGVGVKNSTSDLLIENCDEFIFYEDLVRGQQRPLPQIANVPEKVQECFALLVDSILALQRENKEILWGSMVKETMKRKKPSFNETYYGFRTFSHLLEDAQRRGIVALRRDQRSGSYIIEDLGAASVATATGRMESPAPAPPPASAPIHAPTSVPTHASTPALASGPRSFEAAPARAVDPSAPPPLPAPAAAASVPSVSATPEAAESPNGARGPRRRRGRGRRPRIAVSAARGAPMETTAPATSLEEGPELDGEDDQPEEAIAAAHGQEEPATPAAGGRPEDEPTQSSSLTSEAAPAPGPALAPEPSPRPPAEAERSPFSFFSWIRREPVTPPREDATEPDKREPIE